MSDVFLLHLSRGLDINEAPPLTDAEAYDEALREWGRRDEQNPDSIQPPVEVQ